MEYDYHHAMAQHAAALSNTNQLHPAMAQIPMLSAGLNLTVMPGGLNSNAGQHHLANVNAGGHHVMYANVQGQGGGGGGHHHHQGNQSHKKAKKPKVNKDGVPAPKRATTAYINFTQWYREELKKSGRPIPKIGEFGKECAGKWNAMAEEEKQPFLSTAAKDRERYKREMAVYKPARDVNKPKRPGTAFMLFMGDFRKEMAGKEPEGGVAALAKLGGERWRNMTEEDKRPYVEKQNEEKVRYEAAMEEYRRKSAPQPGVGLGGPSPKQGRLSTEDDDNDESDSGGASNESMGHHQKSQNMGGRQHGVSTPSPAASSSPPTQSQHTVSPSPAGQSANNSHAAQSAALAMAGYSQHSFAPANFGHTAQNYTQQHAHSGNMASGGSSYLPTGGSAAYPQSHLPGHYNWN